MRVADLVDTSVRSYYASLGVVQYGDSLLRQPCEVIDVVGDSERARRVWERLAYVARRVMKTHDFSRGIGLAAPQIGMPYRMALVRPNVSALPLCLCNPVLEDTSASEIKGIEGCLSFFEVRGSVPRPEWIQVRFQRLNGIEVSMRFDGEAARLVCHELDHLDGKLYVDRMSPEDQLLPAPPETLSYHDHTTRLLRIAKS